MDYVGFAIPARVRAPHSTMHDLDLIFTRTQPIVGRIPGRNRAGAAQTMDSRAAIAVTTERCELYRTCLHDG